MHSPATPSGPALGHLDGNTHVYPLRVYYQDTDAEGIVYHANYLNFAERARVEFMRCIGLDQHAQRGHGIVAFAVRQCTVDYRRPARLDDVLAVHTRIVHVGGASLGVEQLIRRDGEHIAGLDVRLVSIDANARPRRLPDSVRSSLRQITEPSDPPGDSAARPAGAPNKE